ncbi:MAG TPA: hydrogenase expression/formation C-terminal domain-containing protein [Lamprocystis sp. (in: g-proteobacteria)]|nr:hydrogenase expression/formation C-terminal domain-containing protein [Lamprocystis sp. (in: g-proteobacteria)]
MRIGSGVGAPVDHGNALPILHEVRHAVERLIATGETTLIDLNTLPFGPGDAERLFALLGAGEVRATVDALGPTHVQETAIPGVWLIDYRSTEDERLALQIAITDIPEILRTQRQDLDTAIAALDACLSTVQGGPRLSS